MYSIRVRSSTSFLLAGAIAIAMPASIAGAQTAAAPARNAAPTAVPSPAPATTAASPVCAPGSTAVNSMGDGKTDVARCGPITPSSAGPTTVSSAAAAVDADQRTYTAGRIDGADVVAAPTPGLSPVSPAKTISEKGIRRQVSAAPVGSACKTTDAKGNPIGGIIVKRGRCVMATPPVAPMKGHNEKGIK